MFGKWITIGFAALALSGCSGTEARLYVEGPAEDKSILVPAGLSPGAKAIKDVFADAGWSIVVSGGAVQTVGTAGEFVNLRTSVAYPARYTATLSERWVDLCWTLRHDKIAYAISISDNVTGQEIAAFSGRECETDIQAKLKDTLLVFLGG